MSVAHHLFAALVEQLGFRVTRLGVSLWNLALGRWTSPFVHLGLRVDLQDTFLVDVGLDDPSRVPVQLRAGLEQ